MITCDNFFKKKIQKKSADLTYLKKFANDQSIIIIDWEDSELKNLSVLPKGTVIKEFKLPVSVFKVIDQCYPDNFNNFINYLHIAAKSADHGLIFYLLARQLRLLLQIKYNIVPTSLALWQIKKLKNHANRWQSATLLEFYQSLAKIDANLKTGKHPYDILKSIEMIAYYYLNTSIND